jgi:putative hydrolase of HD superfamily
MSHPLLTTLLDLLALDDLPRTGWVLRGVSRPESIAGHVLGTCHVVLALGPRVEPALDTDRALAMAVLHDAPEALTGDLPRAAAALLPKGAKEQMEEGAARRLLAALPPACLERFFEYRAGATREARFVRVCDRLQLGVRLAAYHRLGVRGLEDFTAGIEALDCTEFAPAEALRREILAALG